MIKIIEQGQKTFIRTCDRCGCKFQYDLSDLIGLEYISCPCCHNNLIHMGPKTVKIDLSKTNCIDAEEMRKNSVITPNKIEVGDGGYNYGTTTGAQYADPNVIITVKANEATKPSTITGGDPNATIYANKLPDDIVDDPYNNIGMSLPDDIKDNCCYESDDYKAWYEKWCKEIQDNRPIKCKK
jgi:hypothetical protein